MQEDQCFEDCEGFFPTNYLQTTQHDKPNEVVFVSLFVADLTNFFLFLKIDTCMLVHPSHYQPQAQLRLYSIYLIYQLPITVLFLSD